MRPLLAVLLILAACAEKQTKAKFWRKYSRVCVAVDGAQIMLDIQKAAASGAPVIATDLPPAYKLMKGRLIIWPDEGDVPPGVSFRYMTPAQAMRATYEAGGPGGACVAVQDRCDSWLSGQDVNALEEELKKDGLPNLPFSLVRKSG